MIDAADNVLEVVGDTPLVRCHTLAEHVDSEIYLKLEYLNPGQSVKDRPAIKIIEDAEQEGKLEPGGTIVEATSGNTGMGLALAAANKGYNCIFTMPDKMAEEKMKTLRAFGARVVQCPTDVEPDDERSYYSVAERLAEETPGGYLANQYYNPSNPKAHYESTGPEIWEQTDGEIDVFVATMGTGGTISGTAKFLKEKDPSIKVVGVDPLGSIYYDYFKTGKKTEAYSYLVEGFGEDIIPGTMHFDYVDEVVRVSDRECFLATRQLVRKEGIYAGGSSGGVLKGTLKYAERLEEPANIVTILPDSAGRYLSKIFDDDWMRENGFLEEDWSEGTVENLLAQKPNRDLFTAEVGEKVPEVVEKMKQHGISQLPVVDGGEIVGLINETDLLEHLLGEGGRDDAIDELVETQFAIVEPDDKVNMIGEFFKHNKVVIVVDDQDEPVGIITKIDFIDYMSDRM